MCFPGCGSLSPSSKALDSSQPKQERELSRQTATAKSSLVVTRPESVGGSARKERSKAMALSEQEQARVRDEELVRLEAREEPKRRKRPQRSASSMP